MESEASATNKTSSFGSHCARIPFLKIKKKEKN
jgi:hypothetical protein